MTEKHQPCSEAFLWSSFLIDWLNCEQVFCLQLLCKAWEYTWIMSMSTEGRWERAPNWEYTWIMSMSTEGRWERAPNWKKVFCARVLHFEQEAATFSLWEHLGILHLKRDCKPLPGLPPPSLRLESYQNLDSRKVWERVKANAYVQHAERWPSSGVLQTR